MRARFTFPSCGLAKSLNAFELFRGYEVVLVSFDFSLDQANQIEYVTLTQRMNCTESSPLKNSPSVSTGKKASGRFVALRLSSTGNKSQKQSTAGIRWWSPTQLLASRREA